MNLTSVNIQYIEIRHPSPWQSRGINIGELANAAVGKSKSHPSLAFSFKRLAAVDQTTHPSRSQQMTAGRLVRAKVNDIGVADF